MLQVTRPGIKLIPKPSNFTPQQSLYNRARGEPFTLKTHFHRQDKMRFLYFIKAPPLSAWGIGSDSGVESKLPASLLSHPTPCISGLRVFSQVGLMQMLYNFYHLPGNGSSVPHLFLASTSSFFLESPRDNICENRS
jgi:hypothetical protein